MSFSGQVKTELCKKIIQSPCCVRAACYGFACFSRYFDHKGLVLHTERALIAQTAQKLMKRMGLKGDMIEKPRQTGTIYEFAIKDPFAVQKMLAEFGYTGLEPNLRLHQDIFECEQCFYHFLASAFLCSGIVADPAKEYSLEFVSNRRALLDDFTALLQKHGFEPRQTVRKGAGVVYFRASEQVEDLLTAMGATNASLEVMQQKVYKDIRNKTNRITNCESANIDKLVAAAGTVSEAIAYLKQSGHYETLPEALREVAQLRVTYPEYSLAELGQLLQPPLSRAGVCHRMKKLTELAQAIAKNDGDQNNE